MKRIEILTLDDNSLDKKVKIQGTQYDRKRKISDAIISKAKKMWKKNKSISEIARKLDLNYMTVRYNVDQEFRNAYNEKRDGKHTGKDHITKLNRVTYKRQLVAAGKISV